MIGISMLFPDQDPKTYWPGQVNVPGKEFLDLEADLPKVPNIPDVSINAGEQTPADPSKSPGTALTATVFPMFAAVLLIGACYLHP